MAAWSTMLKKYLRLNNEQLSQKSVLTNHAAWVLGEEMIIYVWQIKYDHKFIVTAPIKRWILFPQPLNLDCPLTCFDHRM